MKDRCSFVALVLIDRFGKKTELARCVHWPGHDGNHVLKRPKALTEVPADE